MPPPTPTNTKPSTHVPGNPAPASPTSTLAGSVEVPVSPDLGVCVPDVPVPVDGLRLARPVVRTFHGRADVVPPPEWQRFMADFCAAHDLDFDVARYMSGGGHSFAEMARLLLADLDRPL